MFNIVCITDENYAQHAAVMFESLHATKVRENISVYFVLQHL